MATSPTLEKLKELMRGSSRFTPLSQSNFQGGPSAPVSQQPQQQPYQPGSSGFQLPTMSGYPQQVNQILPPGSFQDNNARIEDLFRQYNIPITYGSLESPQDRIARISREIESGQRDWGSLEASLKRMQEAQGNPLHPHHQAYGERQQAQDLVSTQYDPIRWQLERNLEALKRQQQHQLGQIGSQRDFDINQMEGLREQELERIRDWLERERTFHTQFGGIADQRLEEIYNALNQELGAGVGRQEALFDTARGQIEEAYGAAGEKAQTTAEDVQNRLMADAERLGLEEGLRDPLTQLAEQQMQEGSRISEAGAGAVSDVAGLGASQLAVGQQGIMDAQTEGAQHRANILTGVQTALAEGSRLGAEAKKTINENVNSAIKEALFSASQAMREIQFGSDERMNEILGQLSDLSGIRGAALRTALTEIEDARNDKERQQRLDNLAEELQRHTMNLQRDQFGFQQRTWESEFGLAERQFNLAEQESLFNRNMAIQDLSLRKQAFELQKRQLEAQIQAANDPMARRLAQLELDKINAEISRINAQTGKTQAETGQIQSGSGQQPRGSAAVEQWVSSNIPQNSHKPIMNEFNSITAQASAMGGSVHGNSLAIINGGSYAENEKQALRIMADIYHGKR